MTSNPIPDGSGNPTNPRYVPLDERIYLAPGSSLIAHGERIDNSGAAAFSGITASGHIAGGSISITDRTVDGDGVIIGQGAVVDVSGGYQVSAAGKVTGASAGSLTLEGYSLVVNGDLRAQSLMGNNGGSISMWAGNVTIAPSGGTLPSGFGAGSALPQNLQGQLVLGATQLDGSGFTNITLKSVNDIVAASGVTLAPSPAKLSIASTGGGTPAAGTEIVHVPADLIGTSAITLTAGAADTAMAPSYGPMNPQNNNISARLAISPGAAVLVGPGGSITMSAPVIDIGGALDAPAGTIAAAAGNVLNLAPGASVRAEGYNAPGTVSQLKGLEPDPTPKPGGSVTLSSGGDLILSPGSLVSVSGSSPVSQTVVNADGTTSSVTIAGKPGSISLAAAGSLDLEAGLEGRAMMAGLPGGTLSIANTNPAGTLALSTGDLALFQAAGFDALTLASAYRLSLSGSGQVAFGRKLTLDALEVAGSGADGITLSAPWVQVQAEEVLQAANGGTPSLPSIGTMVPGEAAITLSGTFLDVTGHVLFSGFKTVHMSAVDDIRLTDLQYGTPWSGLLATSGDLTLQAARIYPTTYSLFTVSAGGKVTILPSGTSIDGPVVSAGGSLTIQSLGAGIDQEGYVAAPLGALFLQAPNGRVYLAAGSTTTTKGDAAVVYGSIESGYNQGDLGVDAWVVTGHTGTNPTPSLVQSAPAESISLIGKEVIVRDGAAVDVSGGGSVFAAQFVSSYSGTNNPLTGSYVVLPGNSVVSPGSAVYLSGIKGLPAGVYPLLPAVDASGNPTAYAFMPGAMIVTDLGKTIAVSKQTFTGDGYPIVAGYATTMGTGISSAQYEAYEVRPASVVLAQGDFETQTHQAGAAGSVTVTGSTTILNGATLANPLPGYSGGSIALSGTNVIVQASAVGLPADFGFGTPVPPALSDTLTMAAPSLSGQGFQTIGLGVSDITGSAASVAASTVEIKPGVTLRAENIILGARNSIALDAGAQVLALAALGDTGQASLITPGSAVIASNAVVHASDAVNLQIASLSLDPTAILRADHSALNLTGSTITITGSNAVPSSGSSGLFLTTGQWDSLAAGFDDISLIAVDATLPWSPKAGALVFNGLAGADQLAAVRDTLTIDAGLLTTRVNGADTGSTVTLAARTIVLQNTSGASVPVSGSRGTGNVTFQAQEMQVGKGSILFDGFGTVNMDAAHDLTFRGAGEVPQGATFRTAGTLSTGGADLNIAAGRVTTSFYMQPAGTDPSTGAALSPVYTAADYLIDATTKDTSGNVTGGGRVSIGPDTGAAGTTTTPGGTLAITAGEIDVSTIVEVPSGQIELTATGNITLAGGGQLLGRGTPYVPGGVVSLTSTGGGAVTLAAGSLIDVSAGLQGDAGSISLYAPTGGVTLNGTIQGQATGGKGGSLSMVTGSVDAFSALNNKLKTGGFNGSLSIEATTGNITVAAPDYVQAGSVTITADSGSIDLAGAIDVSGATGGTARIYAMDNLVVTGAILARGTGGAGGDVTLSVSGNAGTLTLAGGTVDVSGGGTVTFEAPLTGASYNQLNMSLSGIVTGASSVVAEAVRSYVNQYPTITSSVIGSIYNDTSTFMNSSAAAATQAHLLSGLSGVDPSTFHFRSGIVIGQTTGNITVGAALDLSSSALSWRFGPGDEPGTLTLRAAGNLFIDANIVDHPTAMDTVSTLGSGNIQPSWDIGLVAGANWQSANPMAVIPAAVAGAAAGSLTIASGAVVYTESGSIGFASGGNTVINDPGAGYIPGGGSYNLGTFSGAVRGDVRGSLTLNGGAIETATGPIDIQIGRDLALGWDSTSSSLGAIRTTGERALGAAVSNYSTYSRGGGISLDVGGDVDGEVVPSIAWLTVTSTLIRRGTYTYTILPNYSSAQGILAMAAGDVHVRAGGNFAGQAGTFGQGDLTIYAGGDLEGRFLVKDGTGTLGAMGNFGMPKQVVNGFLQSWPQLIEMYDARVSVTAQGNVELGAVVNPDLAAAVSASYWDNSYAPNSSITLTAATGDVNMYGSVDTRYGSLYDTGATINARTSMLPASVEITAGGDINVTAGFTQLPAPNGTLSMTAGGNIAFGSGASWLMSDADPARVYTFGTTTIPGLDSHASIPVHTGDTAPATICAGGNIEDMTITLPKMTTIFAGGDIIDLTFTGQNIRSTDVTRIAALGSILYGYKSNVEFEQIGLSGPGYMVVQAAGKIDLGESAGIQAVGNYLNPVLSPSGSLIVAAGFAGALDPQGVLTFFDAVRSAGDSYGPLLTSDPAAASAIIGQARSGIVMPFLASAAARDGGDIIMTSSQISTSGGGGISALATGSVNVGTSALGSGQSVSLSNSSQKNFGILTEAGGPVNVFASGDVNVNEARIMTFRGGDITVWSDRGNVYAGKGDRAAVNAGSPQYICKNGICTLTFTPPIVGSGIRAMTYAPDEFTPAPPIGDLHIFTPSGFVDAGEAGMSGGNLFIGAMYGVLNVANISFAGQTVGLAPATQGLSLGVLTGVTNLLDKTGLAQQMAALGTARSNQAATQAVADMVKWFDVKFVGFDLTSPVAGGEDDERR